MAARVLLQYFDGCPNWQATADHLARLIEEGMDIIVDYERIDSNEEADVLGFRGSPTVLVNGVDPFTNEPAPVGLVCRIYETEQGPAGSPTLSQLRQAVESKEE